MSIFAINRYLDLIYFGNIPILFSADGNKTIIRDVVNYKILFGQIFQTFSLKETSKIFSNIDIKK